MVGKASRWLADFPTRGVLGAFLDDVQLRFQQANAPPAATDFMKARANRERLIARLITNGKPPGR
jgi:hypothetical protein